jgi:hypothetical protein
MVPSSLDRSGYSATPSEDAPHRTAEILNAGERVAILVGQGAAGAWAEVVVCGDGPNTLVTSRKPDDLKQRNEAMLTAFGGQGQAPPESHSVRAAHERADCSGGAMKLAFLSPLPHRPGTDRRSIRPLPRAASATGAEAMVLGCCDRASARGRDVARAGVAAPAVRPGRGRGRAVARAAGRLASEAAWAGEEQDRVRWVVFCSLESLDFRCRSIGTH